jgi:DNA-binding CsgD family transcriptional regulator
MGIANQGQPNCQTMLTSGVEDAKGNLNRFQSKKTPIARNDRSIRAESVKHTPLTKEEFAKLLRVLRTKHSIKEIAIIANRSESTIRRYLKYETE